MESCGIVIIIPEAFWKLSCLDWGLGGVCDFRGGAFGGVRSAEGVVRG